MKMSPFYTSPLSGSFPSLRPLLFLVCVIVIQDLQIFFKIYLTPLGLPTDLT